MKNAEWSFIIAAGGHGSRLGGEAKQFRLLGGIPVWQWSFAVAEELLDSGKISEIVVVLSSEMSRLAAELSAKNGIKTALAGAERSQSVLNGLKVCSGKYVLIHDAARPFLTKELCAKLMEETEKTGAAIPLLPVVDSIKFIDGEKIAPADRTKYFRTQTPQAFEREKLLRLLETGKSAADEASVWIEAGYPVARVEGEEGNFKITAPHDWLTAANLVAENKETRTGHGFDVHPLVKGRRLVLAGVKIADSPVGLDGHSDADVVTHTVMDALLGAAGLPDIGTLFPASNDDYKDADSTKLLDEVVKLIRENGWKIDWVDATLNAQIPKLGGIINELIANLNRCLSKDGVRRFNLKVKSGEKCGSVGRCECMKCHAVATLSRINMQQNHK
ncbi:MAG: 2-C-methyl-D-erythritol 2,4-cyclodiphosphate synthase [Synergistaceae bacterium]|nr:2-C-methyl-D-erythritol 2,4-cyclodiphosphate synthase [Synergistaceae bacterium]